MNSEIIKVESSRNAAWKVWGNPIFRRYCRSRLRWRGVGVQVLLVVLVAGFIVAMAGSIGVRDIFAPEYAARIGIVPLLILQCIILFVLGTAQVAGGMTAERDEGVIDYQRLAPMSPLAKVLGYLFGLPVREYVMFISTLPFAAWLMWRGQVSVEVWLPLYVVVFTSTLLYHFTGLLTGTVARNRRWAFLASIGLVFCLYTLIPQMAKFGLVFFKYLTITPVFTEGLAGLLPDASGRRVASSARFFNFDFSALVFTVFSQGGLILIFIVMLCRKWRRVEAHLLDKLWAFGFLVWILVLLLGNALPLIEPGTLFPSQGLSQYAGVPGMLSPRPEEAVLISGIYGLVTMLLVFVMAAIITPGADTQLRGWRRARKLGRVSLPRLSDASSGFWVVLAMAIVGAVGWFLFSRALVGSRWFSQEELPLGVFVYFAVLLLAVSAGFQSMLETNGPRMVGLVGILIGVVPLMGGAVLSVVSGTLVPAASWLMGVSPLSLPFYTSLTLMEDGEFSGETAEVVAKAFYFWLSVYMLVAMWLMVRLWAFRRSMSKSVLAIPAKIRLE